MQRAKLLDHRRDRTARDVFEEDDQCRRRAFGAEVLDDVRVVELPACANKPALPGGGHRRDTTRGTLL